MKPPIILSAFGTSSRAEKTYTKIKSVVQQQFPEHDIFFGYSSKKIIEAKDDQLFQHPCTIARDLRKSGYEQIFIQPLHLIPGSDYHTLFRESKLMKGVVQGKPLLYEERDFKDTSLAIKRELEKGSAETAVLLLGHGTSHPAWTAYPALLHFCRKKFSNHIYLGVLEKSPDSTQIPKQIAADGYKHVHIIPLLLVTGMHFFRDIIGENAASWKSRLEKQGLVVTTHQEGLGDNVHIQKLFCKHISEYFEVI